MFVSLPNSARGTFTFSSRMLNETTSTISRLVAPRSFIDRDISMSDTLRSPIRSTRCLRTTDAISSRSTEKHSLKFELISLVIQTHEIVKKRCAAIDHQNLTPDAIHQSAAKGKNRV